MRKRIYISLIILVILLLSGLLFGDGNVDNFLVGSWEYDNGFRILVFEKDNSFYAKDDTDTILIENGEWFTEKTDDGMVLNLKMELEETLYETVYNIDVLEMEKMTLSIMAVYENDEEQELPSEIESFDLYRVE